MSLPNPLPDNPHRWDGWRNYNSDDPYERLCLRFDSNPSPEQIDDNCRQLLIWWQKKLPLKSQPSNPLAQMLRGGMDEAPKYLAEAKTVLLDPDARARIDAQLHQRAIESALDEFKKLLSFALSGNTLSEQDEERLRERGRSLGLADETVQVTIDGELARLGGMRIATVATVATMAAPSVQASDASGAAAAGTATAGSVAGRNPFDEFRRILQMSRLCLDGDEMTDDQRDAMCNMGESLGLSGGQAEDLIDEYLEQAAVMPLAPVAAAASARAVASPARAVAPMRAMAGPVAVAAPPPPRGEPAAAPKAPVPAKREINVTPLGRSVERQKYPNYTNGFGMEMLLVPSGQFLMGSAGRDAQSNEQPVCTVTQACFFCARFPVTNAQYEKFDPSHRNKRAPWADDRHPVIYVSAREAENFCKWLSAKEGKKYRLPAEAEWEYAARGVDGRIFPWGDKFDSGTFANFADKRTNFAWRDPAVDDGFAETAPVGSFPKGASPFGVEDLAGNVFEWCFDCFEPYKGKDRTNPRGQTNGPRRNYRGGSWKSRAASLRASARAFNLPDFSSNDVGFRVICECDPA